MKYLFFTGSRSEWGYIRPLLELCKKNKIKYNICATNMHLLDSFGNSSEEIEKDGFKISDKIYMALDGYNNHTMAKSMGIILSSFTDVVQRLKPDWIILAGDRAETLCAGLVGAYTYTPIAHIQAGELSGNIDGLARHAIGKFAHLHFCANKEFSNRLSLRGLFSSEPESDVNIYIDDSLVSWKNGQTFKITFDEINMSGNNIKLWTNSVGGFDQLIFDIDSTQLITNKPYIELVCTDYTNYQFEADILR